MVMGWLHFLSFSLPAGVPLPLAPFLVLLEPNQIKVKVRKKETESCCPARESALPFRVKT